MNKLSTLLFLLIALVASCEPGSVGQGPGGPDTYPRPLGTCPEVESNQSVYLPDQFYCW